MKHIQQMWVSSEGSREGSGDCSKRPTATTVHHPLTRILCWSLALSGSHVLRAFVHRVLCVVQVLLHSCRCCPELCEAAVIAGLPDVLLRSAGSNGNSTATLALLLLSEVVSGVAAAAEALAAGLPFSGSSSSPAALAAAAAAACSSLARAGLCC